MANISDGYGTITVEKVGHELKEFLGVVQDKAYYVLIDDVDNLEPDSDGDVEFTFGAGGRWNYESNIRGYLEGEWMTGEEERKAYNKFIRALKKKDGMVTIEYTDSDTSMDWMGSGRFDMYVDEDKVVRFSHEFEEEPITIERYAEVNGETTRWALDYIHGDEVGEKYDEYRKKVGEEKAVEPEVWFATIYKEEE